MNKQIEEMQKVINCAVFADFKNGHSVCIKTISDHLYNAGYRKQIVGEWKKLYNKAQRYVCTNCNHLFNNKEYKHCQNCGAKMRKEDEKNEKN